MSIPDPRNVPPWPLVKARVHEGVRSAVLSLPGEGERQVVEDQPGRLRQMIIEIVAAEVASEVGRSVRLQTTDPDGTEGLLAVAPDGQAVEIWRRADPAARASARRGRTRLVATIGGVLVVLVAGGLAFALAGRGGADTPAASPQLEADPQEQPSAAETRRAAEERADAQAAVLARRRAQARERERQRAEVRGRARARTATARTSAPSGPAPSPPASAPASGPSSGEPPVAPAGSSLADERAGQEFGP